MGGPHAQPPTIPGIEANQVLAVNGYRAACCVLPEQDGAWVLFGSKKDGGKQRPTLTWFDNNALPGASHQIGPEEFTHAEAVSTAPDGTLWVAGLSWSDDRPGKTKRSADGWISKLDADKQPIFSQVIGHEHNDAIHGISALPDGGAWAVGETALASSYRDSLWLLRLDPRGKVLHEDRLPLPAGTELSAEAVAATADGGAWIVGKDSGALTWGGQPIVNGKRQLPRSPDLLVMRIDAQGNVMHRQTFGVLKESEWPCCVITTNDGGAWVLGYTTAGRKSDLWLLRLEADGRLRQDWTMGGPHRDQANSMVSDGQDGIWLTGKHGYEFEDGSDTWLLHIDANGKVLHDQKIGLPKTEQVGHDLGLAPSGHIWVANNTYHRKDRPNGVSDMLVFRLDPSKVPPPTQAESESDENSPFGLW